ncbi:MAG TPA: alpha/beta fold hydrolase, partial [Thermoanaerobaculia bacterium]
MDGKVVTYRADGEGDPLLLLNGGLMSIASWDPIAPPLAAGRKVVRFDFRGQLLTSGPAPATLDDHASDVLELLDSLAIERADLLGTSFGGLVALIVAGRWPARVRRLVVVTATAALTPEMRRQALALERLAESGDGAALFRLLADGTFSDRYLATQPPG